MDQTTLGIGTRLQHTLHGQGVIVGIKYATYLISFFNTGIKEIDKTDNKLDEIVPENVSLEIETASELETSLLKILRLWGGTNEVVPLGDKWQNGMLLIQPADKTLKPKEIPISDFFHKSASHPCAGQGAGPKEYSVYFEVTQRRHACGGPSNYGRHYCSRGLGSVFKSLWGADLFFDSVSASHELEIQGVFRRSRAAPTKPKPGVITPNGF